MLYHSKASENNSTTRAGTAIMVRKGTNITFKAISDRICQMKTKISNNYTINLINAYAPTLHVSEDNPEIRDQFYDELESVIRCVSNRDYLIVTGDFNAKTGSAWTAYQENMGKYGKGELNSNGKELLEMCSRQKLVLTNTLFRHKMAHRATWESPASNADKDRRNPYRNQIDYVITRTRQQHTVLDSRSQNGLMTFTDHRLVRAKLNLRKLHVKTQNKKTNIDIERLHDPETRARYAVNVEMKVMDAEYNWEKERAMNTQELWDTIVKANHQAANEVIAKQPNKKTVDNSIQKLSHEQKKIYNTINTTSNTERRNVLKRERNKILNRIHEEMSETKKRKIEREIEEIERRKDDSNRMYTAMKNIQRMKKKVPLVVEDQDGITTDPAKQAEIVTQFFQKMFTSEEAKELEDIPPKKMQKSFSEEEVRRAVNSLKNNTSAGIDDIHAEHLKNGPSIVLSKIAEILNLIAETGEYPKEIKTGILVPLQKPGKRKGPPANFRPVILLSLLRKILAICLIKRIGDKIDREVPVTQAAYRAGRGTTEQLLTIKLLAEKAATTPNS